MYSLAATKGKGGPGREQAGRLQLAAGRRNGQAGSPLERTGDVSALVRAQLLPAGAPLGALQLFLELFPNNWRVWIFFPFFFSH
jgi:hypothetical protein